MILGDKQLLLFYFIHLNCAAETRFLHSSISPWIHLLMSEFLILIGIKCLDPTFHVLDNKEQAFSLLL